MIRRPGPARPFPRKTSQRPVSGLALPIEGRSKQRIIRASPCQTRDHVGVALGTKLCRQFRYKIRRITEALRAAATVVINWVHLVEANYLQSVSSQ